MNEDKFEKAHNEWVNEKIKTEKNARVLLQDVYEFLESENRHSQVEAIEKLTGIFYK